MKTKRYQTRWPLGVLLPLLLLVSLSKLHAQSAWATFSGTSGGTSMTATMNGPLAIITAASGSTTTFIPTRRNTWTSGPYNRVPINDPQVNANGDPNNATSYDITFPTGTNTSDLLLVLNDMTPATNGTVTYSLTAYPQSGANLNLNTWTTDLGQLGGNCTNSVSVVYNLNGNAFQMGFAPAPATGACVSSSIAVIIRIPVANVGLIQIRKVQNLNDATTLAIGRVCRVPSIQAQPVSQSSCTATNNGLQYSVTAGGTGLSYDWQYSDDNGASFTSLSCCPNSYPGYNTATLTTNGTESNGRRYRVVVSNLCGTVTSNSATVTLDTAPTITTQPTAPTVCSGNSATYSVTASGTDLTYLWQYSDDGTNYGSLAPFASTYPGYNTDSLTAPVNGGSRTYRVIVTNSCGLSVTSNAVGATVIAPTPTPMLAATTQPTCSVATGTFTISNYNTAYTYTINPATGVTRNGATVTAPVGTYTVSSNNGNCPPTTSSPITLSASTCVAVSGTIFDDTNGLTDSTVNGTGVNGPTLPVYVSLVQAGNVVVTVPVNGSGAYSFTSVTPNSSYSIVLTTNPAGSTAPSLPPNWANTGENRGTTASNDGTPDGILFVTVSSVSVTDANFGIEQLPSAGSGTNTVANAGGTRPVTVPANTFTNTTPSSDPSPGSVVSIRITGFPSNTTSLTIISTVYTLSSPEFTGATPTGVVVPTDGSGKPTVPVLVDPTNDTSPVSIPFKAVDNAGKESTNTGSAVINSSAINVPDLSPIMYARPTTVYKTTDMNVVVDVVELLGVATNGLITVRVTKDAKMPLIFPPVATSIGNRSVQNNLWTLDNSNASYYTLTTTSVVAAGDRLTFGLTGQLMPGATTGTLTVSSTVIGGSGGEVRVNNNVDADKIDYFQQ